jgi:hypothetical protein
MGRDTNTNGDYFTFDHLDNLKQTACFLNVNNKEEQMHKTNSRNLQSLKIGNSNKTNVNTLKRQVSPMPKADNINVSNKKYIKGSSNQMDNNKSTASVAAKVGVPMARNKSLNKLNFKEDLGVSKPTVEVRPASRRPSAKQTPNVPLPTIKTTRNSNSKKINFEIDNIFNIANQFKEDAELQNKINDLYKNIMDIKNVLKTKRTNIHTAPNTKHVRTPSVSARGDKKIL